MKNPIQKLIGNIQKLPGIGNKTAHRLAIYMMQNRENVMNPILNSIIEVSESIKYCTQCHNIDVTQPCNICSNHERERHTICILETIMDLWTFEKYHIYNGVYHILGGTLAAHDNMSPDKLHIESLINRIQNNKTIQEVIIATNGTSSGQTTAHYISEVLKSFNIKITRLAFGMPVGGELDYLDNNTINIAIKNRHIFDTE